MFKLVRMYAANQRRIDDYMPARRTLTSFAVITILLMVITISIACWCMSNYGKGLKQHVSRSGSKSKRRSQDSDGKMYNDDVALGAPPGSSGGPNRMVID